MVAEGPQGLVLWSRHLERFLGELASAAMHPQIWPFKVCELMNHLCWIKNSWANPQFCSPCHLVWNINQLVPRLNIFKTLGSRTLTRNVICIPCSLMSINWLIAWHHRVLILGLGTSNSFKISACCVYRAVERLGGPSPRHSQPTSLVRQEAGCKCTRSWCCGTCKDIDIAWKVKHCVLWHVPKTITI